MGDARIFQFPQFCAFCREPIRAEAAPEDRPTRPTHCSHRCEINERYVRELISRARDIRDQVSVSRSI
jgi:hypothetical protein